MTRHPVHRPRPRLSALILALIACLLALPLVAPAVPAHAAGIIYVDASASSGANDGSSWADAYTTLQAALSAAGSGDAIWVAAGTYYPDEGGGQTDNDRNATFQLVSGVDIYGGYPTGGGTRDWAANPTILSGDIDGNDTNTDGNNINETWNDIQGSNAYHVVTGANNATLDGVTITAGNANGGSVPNNIGGGMLNNTSNPTLTNVTIAGNQATNTGGGMYNDGSSPTLTNVTIAGNQATNTGGGIDNNHSSSPTLTNVTIAGNQANDGGGIYNFNTSNPTLTNVTIAGNQANDGGGGMFTDNSSPTLTNVTIAGNQATNTGGGMLNWYSNPTLTNVTIAGNSAGGRGGGMYNLTSSPTLTNVTIAGNQATNDGGGMYSNFDSSATIQNSIIWGNDASTGPQVSGFPSYANTLVQDAGVGGFNGSEDPLFVAPEAASSAPTTAGDYRLLPGSPVIDQGNNTADLDGSAGGDTISDIATDLDGTPRIADGNADATATVDLGAYELSVLHVDENTPAAAIDQNGAMWDTAFADLHDALAVVGTGMEIWVAAGTYYPDEGGGQTNNDRFATFQLVDGVAIYGGFAATETLRIQRDWEANVTILSGDIAQNDSQQPIITDATTVTGTENNSYQVVTSSDNTVLDGFVVTAGNADGSSGSNNKGGGILHENGTLTVANSTLRGNAARTNGGAIDNAAATAIITNSIFLNNTAGNDGGAIGVGGSGTVTIHASTFRDNESDASGPWTTSEQERTLRTKFTMSALLAHPVIRRVITGIKPEHPIPKGNFCEHMGHPWRSLSQEFRLSTCKNNGLNRSKTPICPPHLFGVSAFFFQQVSRSNQENE